VPALPRRVGSVKPPRPLALTFAPRYQGFGKVAGGMVHAPGAHRRRGGKIVVNVRQALHVLWLRRWLVIVTMVTALAGAVTVGLIVPPRYEATARVMLAMFKPDPVTGEFINGKSMPAYIATEAEMVRDYRVAGRVVDDLGWTSSPELLASYEARDPSDTRDFRRWLAQRVSDNTGVGLTPETNIMEIKVGSSVPEQAARLANAIRDAFIAQDVAERRTDAETTADWITRQVASTGKRLLDASRRQQEFERANGIVLRSDGIDTETLRLQSANVLPRPGFPVRGPDSGLVAGLQAANAALASAERELGPNNPDLKSMRTRRDALAAAVAQSGTISRLPVGPAPESYGAIASKVLARADKVAEAQQLAADVAILRRQYDALTQRLADLTQQSEIEKGGLQSMGDAAIPTKPVSPNWYLILLGSSGLGLLLGCITALMAELLGQRVRSRDDLAFGDVPLLGELSGAPRLKPARGASLWHRIRSRLPRWPGKRRATAGAVAT
jgi:uncharacterized protein involved in exopolysaccharide biosynthesis